MPPPQVLLAAQQPQVLPSARPRRAGMPRRARAQLRAGGQAYVRSDDSKQAGPSKITRAVWSMVLIGPESVVIVLIGQFESKKRSVREQSTK
jgi:hypothetical protein